jgi:hypothetical protein
MDSGIELLFRSTDPLVDDVSGGNEQVAARNFSSQHASSAVQQQNQYEY